MALQEEREVAIQDGTFDKKYSGSDNPDKVAWYEDNSEKADS